jgi:protein-tyrosine phosphatase
MRDIHSHILPCVDDGARDLSESLAIIEAARRNGVTSIVCTPHVRDPYFDYDRMWDAFDLLASQVDDVELQMGWEVNWRKLQSIGYSWIDHLKFDGGDEFLLELPFESAEGDAVGIERTVAALQGMGCRVIVAHPERCSLVRDDLGYARRLVELGCELQASADFIEGGRAAGARKTARRIAEAGLYTYVASDAHRARHYDTLGRAIETGVCHV